ncbi:MAG: molybdopterin-synthase adenylyltransferase MoeB, partial [Anaerolineae bacterium]|nr:molybdopterin-synthase adenylyltransferase MoeB [Thermoflexales bacterium]MDW8408655.1 molybdopterin-synthase adenylyltransferase MoeB [Anaerolineae bacterium]
VGCNKEVSLEAETVQGALTALVEQHPALKKHLFNEQGKLRSFVNVYLGDEDVRHLQGADTPLPDGAQLSIVPSVAGGAGPTAVAQEMILSNAEIRRYSRHLIMPEIGMSGQKKLKAGSVLLIGAGGLGSPAAMYLAAAGVGRIGLVDFDVVSESNLQRQIIHGQSAVGRPKLESARARLLDINPFIQIDCHEEPLTSANALRLFADYDVILDGTDNFPTRYLVNDACVLLGKPNVYGSIFRFEGQASVFWAERGPCYRCLYPEPPPPGLVPSCAEGGVLGVLPGVIGVIQATEAVKLIVGIGDPLIGRLMLYDALEMRFRELKLRKDPHCPLCGEQPTIHTLIDYEAFCGMPAIDPDSAGRPAYADVPEITVRELHERIQAGLPGATLIDVREPQEWEIAHLPAARLIPKGELPNHLGELSQTDEILVHCRSGVRSAEAVQFLRQMGFKKAKNVKGGILAWAREIDPSMPTY